MSQTKKQVRELFRNSVFVRDNHCCRVCGVSDGLLDAHHITDRNKMPNGGYVKENGISLCAICHNEAENFHRKLFCQETFLPNELYHLIGSSYDIAVAASEKSARAIDKSHIKKKL